MMAFGPISPQKKTPRLLHRGVLNFERGIPRQAKPWQACLVALVIATATAATTTAATTAEGTALSAATTTAAAAACFTRAGFIDGEGTAAELLAIEHFDGFLGFLGGAHGDEGETAGLAGHAVLHEGGFRDGSGLLEEVFKFEFEGLKGEVPYV
jgi:hypothetical protein